MQQSFHLSEDSDKAYDSKNVVPRSIDQSRSTEGISLKKWL